MARGAVAQSKISATTLWAEVVGIPSVDSIFREYNIRAIDDVASVPVPRLEQLRKSADSIKDIPSKHRWVRAVLVSGGLGLYISLVANHSQAQTE